MSMETHSRLKSFTYSGIVCGVGEPGLVMVFKEGSRIEEPILIRFLGLSHSVDDLRQVYSC